MRTCEQGRQRQHRRRVPVALIAAEEADDVEPVVKAGSAEVAPAIDDKGVAGAVGEEELEVELDAAEPSPISASTPSTSPASAPSLPACQAAGDRVRPHGSVRRRAKANARAAQHRIFQALPFPGGFSDTQSPPDPPPSRRPLQHHPSPTVEGRRKILTVKKPAGCQPTFATLNGANIECIEGIRWIYREWVRIVFTDLGCKGLNVMVCIIHKKFF